MPSLGFYLCALGLAPLALTACAEIEAATAQPVSVVPAVGIDLGSSSRVPQIAGLAGEGEGYGRTEPGATPMPHGSMTGMSQAAGMPPDHGSMAGMDHGAMSGMPMDHGSMPGMNHSSKGGMRMARSGKAHAQGTGTVNSVDTAAHKVNVSHAPIPAIGFPAMTMDFAVAPSVDLKAVKPSTRINFTVERGEGGMYVIQSITPAGGGR
jgi:Cu(I)/Ag(I) efflux system protein CusF